VARPIYLGAAIAVLAFSAAIIPGNCALAADESYNTRLTAVAFDGAMRANVQGDGHASAVLSGNKLSITGNYTELPSAATSAHVLMGPAIGVPGQSISNLNVSGGTDGSISGDFVLDRQQLKALLSGHLYVQLDSQKAPEGNLWGWLMPEHPVAPSDVPLSGHGFLPQLDVPGNWTVVH
jgi:CHRD domain